MVKFKVEIPEVPRKEIDRLENALDKLLYGGDNKNKDRWECSGNNIGENLKKIPFADLWIKYGLGELTEIPAIEIDAKGIIQGGNFKVVIGINMPDQAYGKIEKTLIQEAPYIGKLLEKKSKINS